jgi:hypothetical protein
MHPYKMPGCRIGTNDASSCTHHPCNGSHWQRQRYQHMCSLTPATLLLLQLHVATSVEG